MRLRVLIAPLLLAGSLLTGCMGGALQGLLPPVYEYTSLLVPTDAEGDDAYSANSDGSITYDEDGLRVTVRPLSDTELNERYPDVSYQDRFSANPFTYGNWRDPSLGYTPSRFTVFEVEVFNPVLPKVELSPDDVVMHTGQGEFLKFFGINREDSENSLEDFYTLNRGPGGNEQYRFDQRMGIIREELYRFDQLVFKGDDYSGFIVFQALNPDVISIELLVTDFALQFDESNNPSRTTDLTFRFDRQTAKRRLEGDEELQARSRTWVLPASARR